MPAIFPKTKTARRRLMVAYHIMFGLLLAHFLLVHFNPTFRHTIYHGISGLDRGFGAGAARAGTHVIERNGDTYLWGGNHPEAHFHIGDFDLDPDRLNHGIGREHFPALVDPEFDSMETADKWLDPRDRVLTLRLGGDPRVYPLDLLVRHEVVNDVVGGVPVFAAFCFLADLGAVYDRRIAGNVLTFALSGYTYSDPDVWKGMEMFILWDRETESLWWSGSGRAVSGLLIGAELPLVDERHWAQTTWGEAKERLDNARVLRPGQDFKRPRPGEWPRLDEAAFRPDFESGGDRPVPVAPQWGANRGLR